jgi:hypothetical protein
MTRRRALASPKAFDLASAFLAATPMVGHLPKANSRGFHSRRDDVDVGNVPRALLATEHRPTNGCIAFIVSLNYDMRRGNAVSP